MVTLVTIICSKLIIERLKKVWNMFKVNNKTPKRPQWRRAGVFIVNFEHIFTLFPSVSIVDFEQVNVGWVIYQAKFLE